MFKEFKEFIMRGNVIDLAVAVVVGGAFTNIVTAISDGLIGPIVSVIIKAITGSREDSIGLAYTTKTGVVFDFGMVIYAIIAFLITAFVVFLIVKAMNTLRDNMLKPKPEPEPEKSTTPSEEYLKEIVELLKKEKE